MGPSDISGAFHQIVTRGKTQIERTDKRFYLNRDLPAGKKEQMGEAYKNVTTTNQ
jgi:hypothetical protein